MEKAAEFDQSALFKKVYEEEFGTFGGAPFGALIGDYEFSSHPQDLSLLEKISNVAAAANAPFTAAASPQMFGWDSFTDLSEVRDLAKIFDRTEFAKCALPRSEDRATSDSPCRTLDALPTAGDQPARPSASRRT